MQIGTRFLLGTMLGFASLTLPRVATADTISITSLATSPLSLNPSSDTITLNSSSASIDTRAGVFTLQTGDFLVGNSPIADQIIPFSFLDTITLDGVTRAVTISGQVQITTASDSLVIFGGVPVQFGGSMLIIQPLQVSGYNIGDDIPITVQAVVTPEPVSLLLLGTGVIGGLFLTRGRTRPALAA